MLFGSIPSRLHCSVCYTNAEPNKPCAQSDKQRVGAQRAELLEHLQLHSTNFTIVSVKKTGPSPSGSTSSGNVNKQFWQNLHQKNFIGGQRAEQETLDPGIHRPHEDQEPESSTRRSYCSHDPCHRMSCWGGSLCPGCISRHFGGTK